eukprot:scaffold15315_cov30-Tisochrysis_lutea.AAC.5
MGRMGCWGNPSTRKSKKVVHPCELQQRAGRYLSFHNATVIAQDNRPCRSRTPVCQVCMPAHNLASALRPRLGYHKRALLTLESNNFAHQLT